MTDGKKWVNVDAGPRMVKQVNEAISSLRWESNTFIEVYGVVGGQESRSVMTEVFGTGRQEVLAKGQEIGEKYDWKVTKANYKEILADFAAAVEEAKASREVRDERRTQEEESELREQQAENSKAYQERSDRETALREQVREKAPSGAHAVIMAELNEDTSDIMTDYFANKTVRAVAIGFRFSKREDFKALRRAAGEFPETKHLGPDADKDIEHRDNYSMGKGNYLSDHGWDGSGSGWVVKSYDIGGDWWHVDEDAIPEQAALSTPAGSGEGYEVRPSSLGRDGVVEIHFTDKPDEDVRASLKAAGFRWARGNRCWYGREDRMPSL